MTYKILFIDEQKEAHRSFKKDFLDRNRDRFSGEYMVPVATLEEMMEIILEKAPDVVLTDFSLNDIKVDLPSPYTVEYNGGELANELLARRKNFPVFIATSLGDDAARGGYDVRLIFEKYGSFREKSQSETEPPPDIQHLTFSDRIFYGIQAYRKSIDDALVEFDTLLEKRKSEVGLTLSEEERLATLDNFIESSLDARSKLPDTLRATTTIQRLDSLISLAEKIINNSKGKP
ncbi:hypothetical protein [Achromobacter xylosoxidans]|jgi:hypothetical protein|uniref:hypothetical protein n=1 Tax=Alcaligenes xylosoxydans xylosoxydans TaxID=85698 RepID=UPI0006C3CC74|nr:hypothetical protein [Achromobacter xylosoxidans]QQE58952.1 hypothetical protein I6H41_08130 [Achromobacter xylosoxidans]QQV12696.1 hypothetical protein I6I48_23250 [Achromobacter xylosoxidans]UXL02758.1 hypothetical protein N4T34_17935 [Achromobacter xylosoxidans]CUJ18196.1 Uncharacterised protein [Achromobacter xylosoxidans]